MARRADPEAIARKREAITVAAGELFGTRGYERTSVADIASAVGTSPASVFYYFDDKAAIFRAVFERDLPAAHTLVARHRESDAPLTSIVEMTRELAKDAEDPSAPGIMVELLRRIEHDPLLSAVVGETAAVLGEGLTALIARGIEDGDIDPALDPADTAAWLQAIVDACYLNAPTPYSPLPALRRTVLGYLASPSHHQEHKP